ncbi:MAG: site-specific integrase [Casimicrobiaceae bacterium]
MAFKVRPRRNGKFQATVEAPGFPPVSGTFPDEGSARSWAIATHTTVLSGGFLPLKPKARALVKVVLAEYEKCELPAQASEMSSRSRIKTLTRLLGELTLADLTVEALEAFKCIRMGSVHGPARGGKQDPPRETRYRLKGRAKRLVEAGEKEQATVSSQSCRHEVMLLQRAVRWWSYQHGLALEKRGHPLFAVKLPAKSLARERRFEVGEEARLFAAIDDDKTLLGRAVTLLLESGMRRSELAGAARWENLVIDDDYAVLWLPETKHPDPTVANGRFVALSPRAVAVLRELGIRQEGLILPIKPDSLTQSFGRARERAGIKGLRLQDTRREAASRKAEEGWSLPMTQAFTGHKDPRVLAGVYLRLRATMLSRRMHLKRPTDRASQDAWD